MDKFLWGLAVALYGILLFSLHYQYNPSLDIFQPVDTKYIYQRALVQPVKP